MTDRTGSDGPDLGGDPWGEVEVGSRSRRPAWVVAVALIVVLALVLPVVAAVVVTLLGVG